MINNKKLIWRLLVIICLWVIIPTIGWIIMKSWKIDNLGYRIIIAILLACSMWVVAISIFWFIKGFWNEWNKLKKENKL